MNPSIVCGIDNSPVSHAAARVAAGLARNLRLDLVLAHVADDPPTFPYRDVRRRELQRRDATERATAMLVRVAATLPGVVAKTRVLLGDPVEELTAVSREEDVELLILGSRGRGPLAAAVLGGVSSRVASAAGSPVVVVASPDAADRFLARGPRGTLVCGLDGSVGATRALRLAAGLAERLDLELLPMHVDPDGTWADALGPDASAIVVGSRGRGTWQAAALGSVSGELAATSPVPVVVVPPTADVTRLGGSVADDTVDEVLDRARRRTAHRVADVVVDRTRTRRFSEGIEQLPDAASTVRPGSFAEGYDRIPARRP